MTPGLLASMMMRSNHAVFMPYFEDDIISRIAIGRPEERIPKGIDQAISDHEDAVAGTLTDVQILEEVTGRGFYAPDREEGYAAMLDAFPGMLALAIDRIARRT
jgi:hypothetical protein